MEWREAGSYVTSSDGLRVLLTGSFTMAVSAGVMTVISWFLSRMLYDTVGGFLTAVGENILIGKITSLRRRVIDYVVDSSTADSWTPALYDRT